MKNKKVEISEMLLKKSVILNSILSTTILLLIVNFVTLRAQTNKNVCIPGTEVRNIYSKINNQEYTLNINLPRHYEDTSQTFPTVYLLDSQWDFPLVQAIYGEQYYDGFLPELVIVGVTWGGKNPNADILRARDFTPTDIHQNNPTGNAEKFLEFIKSELIPFIEKNYRVSKNDRTLIGSSLGGLFTLYTMFTQNEIFNKYVLTSPALTWDHNVLYDYEEKYFISSDKLPVKLAMCVGELEGLYPPFVDFVKKLKERNYKGLELYTKVIDGIGHSGGKADGYTRGLQFVFAKPIINLNDSILNEFAGEYQINPQLKIKITIENSQLFVFYPPNNKIKLNAESENNFYVKGEFNKIQFLRNSSNQIMGLKVQRYDGEYFASKVN